MFPNCIPIARFPVSARNYLFIVSLCAMVKQYSTQYMEIHENDIFFDDFCVLLRIESRLTLPDIIKNTFLVET